MKIVDLVYLIYDNNLKNNESNFFFEARIMNQYKCQNLEWL